MKRPLLWLSAALGLGVVLAGCGLPAEPEVEDGNARAQFPSDKHGELVYQGFRGFTQTP